MRSEPIPTKISSKLEAEAEKNLHPASFAKAFANNVLPVPGAPVNNIPFGSDAPILSYLSLFYSISTTSSSSSLYSSIP